MDAKLRNRILDLVQKKVKLDVELSRLRERGRAIDAEIDQILGEASGPAARSASKKPARRVRKAEPKAPSKAKPTAKPKTAAKRPPKAKPAKNSPIAEKAPAKAKKSPVAKKSGGPTLKEKLLKALTENPKGLDVTELAKRTYGAGEEALRLCQSYLYTLGKQKVLKHEGTVWRIVGGASG